MKFFFITVFAFLSFCAHAQVAASATEISPILIGEKVPDLSVYDEQNKAIPLESIFNKPTVLVFFRGGWCPYCNVHLADLAKIEDQIIALGYQIVAISPDDFENVEGLEDKLDIKYKIYSDKKAAVIQSLGIGYQASDKTKKYISGVTKGETTEVLPVPALFVIDENSEVLFEYLKPDITKRIPGKLLLSVLEGLK
jgi:peroxiredoxin